MVSTFLVGSTGLVGSHILTTLLSHPTISNVWTLSRRAPKAASSPKLNTIISSDTTSWASQVPEADIFFSGLATTTGQAGGFENQYKIDHDLNLELAKAAKARGVKVYVLISSIGGSTTSRFAYMRMKAELEEGVKALGFEHTILLRPGLLIGQREDSRPAEKAFQMFANFVGVISGGYLKDAIAQDAEVIGRAAVSAGLKALEKPGEVPKVWTLSQGEIIKLGRTEWKQ
jgi:uncharacterized protein YbjT (DUF2867 family)